MCEFCLQFISLLKMCPNDQFTLREEFRVARCVPFESATTSLTLRSTVTVLMRCCHSLNTVNCHCPPLTHPRYRMYVDACYYYGGDDVRVITH